MDKIRIFEAFAGYGSQSMAMQRLKEKFGLDYEIVGISEIDKYAIQAYNAVHPGVKNYGDISKIDWNEVPDFELFTYSFPCFTSGTLVLTDNGYKSIESISNEDKVLTHTNRFMNVITPMVKQYEGELYKINAMSFDELTCTPEHPFYVRKRYRYGHYQLRAFKKPEWVNAEDLTKDHYLGYAINQESSLPNWDGVIDNRWGHSKISNKLSDLFSEHDFWYVMGRYIGDGWKRTNEKYGSGIIICCSNRNEVSLINALNNIGFHYTRIDERPVTKLQISSNELHAFVDRYGYYAHGKKIDIETMNLPVELLKYFIEGVMDSDGYIDRTGLHKINSVSKELIYGLAQCVAKVYKTPFGIYCTKRDPKVIIEGRECNQRPSYSLHFKLHKRKQDHAFYEDGYIWFPIKDISSKYSETDVYNMSVEEDESYTANGCIVHNCTDISSAGQQKGLEKGSGTRSSLLWECQKAIEIKRPKYCLMENVAALVSEKFLPYYLEWERLMTRYGYTNYNKVLNAKDFGVPQNRERIFMVSIHNAEQSYYWPEPFKLEKRLKDVLEQNVDERYYLSQQIIDTFNKHKQRNLANGNGFGWNPLDKQTEYSITETIRIPQATEQGYVEVPQGAVFDGSYPNSKTRRGRLQDGGQTSPTLMACGESPCYYEGVKESTYRIRKLTEREVFRLMGVSESDIDKIQASGVSRSQQYKMAGNSIVVDVLEHIFRKLFIETGQESQQLSLF